MIKDPLELPDDLPVPEDDGAADHLPRMALPPVALRATDGAEHGEAAPQSTATGARLG